MKKLLISSPVIIKYCSYKVHIFTLIKDRLILSLLVFFLITGCGMSESEKEDLVTISCNVMKETRYKNPSDMIKEVNHIRERIEGDAFLLLGEDISRAIEYDLCEELVLDHPNYEKLLKENIQRKKEMNEREILKLEKSLGIYRGQK